MGKSQSREQVIIAQNGAENKATTSLFHEITHGKLDLIAQIIIGTIAIIICVLIFRFCKKRYTQMLRTELRSIRDSRRGRKIPMQRTPAPTYTVA